MLPDRDRPLPLRKPRPLNPEVERLEARVAKLADLVTAALELVRALERRVAALEIAGGGRVM